MNIFSITIIFFLSLPSWGQGLNQNLELQFEKYKKTQRLLLDRVVREKTYLKRAEWDISLETGRALDLGLLRSQQLLKIKISVEKEKLESKNKYNIQLDSMRNKFKKIKKFCRDFPKGGMLHVHGDGTLNRDTVRELLTEANPKISGEGLLTRIGSRGFSLYPREEEFLGTLTPQSFMELGGPEKRGIENLFFLPRQPYSHSFSRFMAFFFIKGIIYRGALGYEQVGEKIYRDFFKRTQENKVLYVEFTDAQLKPRKASLRKLQRLADLAKKYGVTARWNISFYRSADAQENEKKIKAWIEFLKEEPSFLIVGIDFLADESENPALEQGQGVYAQVLNANNADIVKLHRTMHAGELGHPKNVRDAMIMGVERVGHGVNLWEDPVALEYARRIKLGVETNLVSNFRLRVVKDKNGKNCSSDFCNADHPFIKYLRLGLKVSFSTDDEGLFETTMNKECEVAIRTTDIQYSELRQISINGIESSFAKEQIKKSLKIKLEKNLRAFEESWKAL